MHKALVIAALSLFASLASAAETEVRARQAFLVGVQGVEATISKDTWWLTTNVKVKAVFGNACQVPQADEYVVVADYSEDYSVLKLTLAHTADRICPLLYDPVEVTIDLGQYYRTNEDPFAQILVNGVEAIVVE